VALAELGELLQSCSSINEATRIFARLAGNILPDHSGALYLISPSRDEAVAVAYWGGGEAFSHAEFVPDDCWALRLGRTHRSTEGNTMYCEHMLKQENETVCLPLHAFGDTIGMLLVIVPTTGHLGRAAEQQHYDFLETVAEHLALALANLRMREKLRNQSIRDPLTGLYNRRYLEESFRRELHRASRHESPLSVLVFDIDHFKHFNDTHGHDGGDAVLRSVGHCLQEFFRSEDGAYRAGGEEFVAVLSDTVLADAVARAEDLREQISRMDVHHGNVVLPSITISVGVATYPEHGRSAEQLLKAADRALYRAKGEGRNRVIAAEETE
jgi:diguanylate cyclase (GGDEF)-like protein